MSSLLNKIHAVRGKNLSVVKTGEIPGFGNRKPIMFASYFDVWACLSKELEAVGLTVGFISAALSSIPTGSEAVKMVMEVSDGETAERFDFEMLLPDAIRNKDTGAAVTNSSQRVAIAESYLRRTALIQFFSIATGSEDDVERLTPRAGQTDDPTLIVVNEKTVWQDLTSGTWADAEDPLREGKLRQYDNKALATLWLDYPDHAGLLAWAADYISERLEKIGWAWIDLVTLEPSLPSALQACKPDQLRAAAKLINSQKKDQSK